MKYLKRFNESNSDDIIKVISVAKMYDFCKERSISEITVSEESKIKTHLKSIFSNITDIPILDISSNRAQITCSLSKYNTVLDYIENIDIFVTKYTDEWYILIQSISDENASIINTYYLCDGIEGVCSYNNERI